MSETDSGATTDERNELVARRAKRDAWLTRVGSYPNDFRRDATAAALHERAADLDKAALEARALPATVCGRVLLRRVMGKASFVTLADVSGTIQCYLTASELGDAYQEFKELTDIGDFLGVEGTLMRTNKGELTVQARVVRLLNKTLRPLPEKFHGLTDQEQKYRRRYVDLIVNEESRALFRLRARVVALVRQFFVERDFLEVETPMMHPIQGGATARPFVTHHNALDMPLYLRIAPELYLKRLVVGGYERVFEINRSFRNEGVSTRHNPEFTMLEFYQAYADYTELMDLTEELLRLLIKEVRGAMSIEFAGDALQFAEPFARLTMADAIVRYSNLGEAEAFDRDALGRELTRLNVAVEPGWGVGRCQMELFEQCAEPRLVQPTFITEYPSEVSPLARRNDRNPLVTDRFELFIAGREYANGFSELNDPVDQAERFEAQVAAKDQGDEEAMQFDQDYVEALEYGLPPTAGEGIGIDRLVMLLADANSIRDVLLFPLMRPRG